MAVARSSKLSSSKRRWRLRWILAAIAAVLVIAALFVIRPFWSLSGHFDEGPFRQPSRLYGRATRLFEGRNFPPEMLIASLADEGYREDKTSKSLPAGRYRRTEQGRPGGGDPPTELPAARRQPWRRAGPDRLPGDARRRPPPRRRGDRLGDP